MRSPRRIAILATAATLSLAAIPAAQAGAASLTHSPSTAVKADSSRDHYKKDVSRDRSRAERKQADSRGSSVDRSQSSHDLSVG